VSIPPFEQVISDHGSVVLRVCRALVGPDDAEDAWSETFLECVRYFVRGAFSCPVPDVLSGVFLSRYLMSVCPFYPVGFRNRTFRAVPGRMLRVPVFLPSCAVPGAAALSLADHLAAVPVRD
jgi:hypothetical protein